MSDYNLDDILSDTEVNETSASIADHQEMITDCSQEIERLIHLRSMYRQNLSRMAEHLEKHHRAIEERDSVRLANSLATGHDRD